MNTRQHSSVQITNMTKDLANCVAFGHAFNAISHHNLSAHYFAKETPSKAQ